MIPLAPEPSLAHVREAVNQIVEGRSNAHGSFTVPGGVREFRLEHVNIAPDSHISLTPRSRDAAQAMGGMYIEEIGKGYVTFKFAVVRRDAAFTFAVHG